MLMKGLGMIRCPDLSKRAVIWFWLTLGALAVIGVMK